MKLSFYTLIIAVFLLGSCTGKDDLATNVNPFIGTGAHGHTFPGAITPFGMVQLSPDTRTGNWDACSGYHYSDSMIIGFSHTHLSGTGCIDLGDILIRPTVDPVSVIDSRGNLIATPFNHSEEIGTPGYYRVKLGREKIDCELTATSRTGIHRYTFPLKKKATIIVDLAHQLDNETAELAIQSISENEISGFRFSKGWAEHQRLFFVARFSQPFDSVLVFTHGESVGHTLPFSSDDIKLFLSWNQLAERQIGLNVGISAVSIKGARLNLQSEAPVFDFDFYREKARDKWNKQLSLITVEGGTRREREIFYTALYHSSIAPNIISDQDGNYLGMDQQIHRDTTQNHYTTFSLWDTFRAWHPLMTLLDEHFVNEMINSMLANYQQTGELPIWPLWGSETNTMIGYHSVSVIADAWMKGIRGFDENLALEAMIASSNTRRKGNDLYREHGFIPANNKKESVSCLLEYAYDDWCISLLADSLGEKEVAKEYSERACNYQNVFDGNTRFFRGKKDNGNWISPFDPFEVSRDMTEATAWQYRFFVPHDIQGLVNLFGGKAPFVEALDALFNVQSEVKGEMSDITGLMGQYAHGNEPSHHMAYLYSFIGQPWKTQYYVNQLQNEIYDNTPEGISGNEDCGQMSAWHIMSSLGFYSVCPGSNQYILTTPRFEEITLQLGNGKTLKIETDSNPQETPYIKRVLLNGEVLNAPFVTHQQLTAGGTLSFELASRQQKENVAFKEDRVPYSLSKEKQVSVPFVTKNINQFIDSCEIIMGVTTPDATIYYTLDGTEPSQNSLKYTSPIVIRKSKKIMMKAFRENYKPSPICSVEANKAFFYPSVKHHLRKKGVRYRYYEGTFTEVSDLKRLKPVKAGDLNNFFLQPALQEDHFGFKFESFIEIPGDGLYDFYTISDDGSVLWIDGIKVVDNDGSHAAVKVVGTIALKKGVHRINVSYIEDYEGNSLEVGMSVSGSPGEPIEDNKLWK